MKKQLSLILVLVMLFALLIPTAALAEEDEVIHLTYAMWDDCEFYQALADYYHELNPSVEIEILDLGGSGDYTENLYSLMQSGEFPDLFQVDSLDDAIAYGWMLDLTEYCEADAEWTEDVPQALQSASCIDGRIFQIATESRPVTFYLDEAIFERLGMEMPGQDWTWEEMIALIETIASADEEIWAYASLLGLAELATTSMADGVIGDYGWDGEAFQFEIWADWIAVEAEYQSLGYSVIQDSEEWLAAAGSADVWPGSSGLVAVQVDTWSNYGSVYSLEDTVDSGIQMVPYSQPVSEDVEDGTTLSWIDFAAISSATEYPQEAYEALKFMSFSEEGWLVKCELYQTLTDANGDLLYTVPDFLPATVSETVWEAYRALFDDSWWWDDFFANCRNPVPFGERSIPGFEAFMAEMYYGMSYNGVTGIETAIFEGEADPEEYEDLLNEKALEYYNTYMENFYEIYGE